MIKTVEPGRSEPAGPWGAPGHQAPQRGAAVVTQVSPNSPLGGAKLWPEAGVGSSSLGYRNPQSSRPDLPAGTATSLTFKSWLAPDNIFVSREGDLWCPGLLSEFLYRNLNQSVSFRFSIYIIYGNIYHVINFPLVFLSGTTRKGRNGKKLEYLLQSLRELLAQEVSPSHLLRNSLQEG